MYNLLLSINAIWLICIIALLISPQKCLFFIDKTKRKRTPYIFLLLGGYILFFVFASPVIEKTPERIAERKAEAEQKELEEIQQLKGSELTSNEKELNLDIRGAWESIGYYHKTRPYDPDLHKFEIIEFIPSDSLIAEISYTSNGSPQLKSKYRIVGRALIYNVTKEGDNQISFVSSTADEYFYSRGTGGATHVPCIALFKKPSDSPEIRELFFKTISSDSLVLAPYENYQNGILYLKR